MVCFALSTMKGEVTWKRIGGIDWYLNNGDGLWIRDADTQLHTRFGTSYQSPSDREKRPNLCSQSSQVRNWCMPHRNNDLYPSNICNRSRVETFDGSSHTSKDRQAPRLGRWRTGSESSKVQSAGVGIQSPRAGHTLSPTRQGLGLKLKADVI